MCSALRKGSRFCIVLNSYIISCSLFFFIIGFLAKENLIYGWGFDILILNNFKLKMFLCYLKVPCIFIYRKRLRAVESIRV